MAIYHCSIKVISRSSGRSAIASAAYRSGERLYDEEIREYSDFTRKGGVVYSEILLPKNAPEEYSDRQTLWNAVQKNEKRSDAELCREVEVALPVEWTREQQIEYTKQYCNEQFVSQGMIADFAIHDKGDGNPHAHILLTVRGFDENHKWQQKEKSVFANARDEEGRAIFNPDLPSYDPNRKTETEQYRIPKLDKDGNQIVRTRTRKNKDGQSYESKEYSWERVNIPLNDWHDRSKAEIWRAGWEKVCNEHLPEHLHVDHRSYVRQGIERVPTIHEGVTARKMEKEGSISDRIDINRQVREANRIQEILRNIQLQLQALVDKMKEKARKLYERIARIGERDRQYDKQARGSNGPGRTSERGDGGKGQNDRSVKGITVETERNIEEADSAIAEAKSKFIEFEGRLKSERKDVNERLQRLRSRSQDSAVTRRLEALRRREEPDIGRNTTGSESELRSTAELIRELNSTIEFADRTEEDSRAGRENREHERQRLAAEEKRRSEERSRRDDPVR